MEKHQLQATIARFEALFSPSAVSTLPSVILKNHVNLLFGLYSIIPDSPDREKLKAIIVFVLINRDRNQLQNMISSLRLKDSQTLNLHPRIVHKNDSLQIGEEKTSLRDDTESFMQLVKSSNNNFLIYDVFICLVNLLGEVQSSGDNFLSEYSVSEDELPDVLHRKFIKKLSILEPLQEMIKWKSLHSQLNEKPQEVMQAVKKVLLTLVERSNSVDNHLILIFFTVFKELIHKLRSEDQREHMEIEFAELKSKCKNLDVRQQLEEIFRTRTETPNVDSSQITFEEAMKLMRSGEIYCKVYGSDTMIKLLKIRDQQCIQNRHVVLAVALENLKETESYAYLNIIRLLVALTREMDSEVIDALIAEYRNQERDVNERLKVGEALVKVVQYLGDLSAKFQDILIRCFLSGSRDHNNEFRASSLSNLGTICKLLSYQIHKFFQEMLQQLEIILQSDEYLPSKRASALVLSQVLEGMPNLMDFQEFLLPVYRLLKNVLAYEHDTQTRIHAEIGLQYLNSKTKDFLNPDLKVSKEIRILLDENPHKLKEIQFK